MFFLLVIFNFMIDSTCVALEEWQEEKRQERQVFWSQKILGGIPQDKWSFSESNITWKENAHPITCVLWSFLSYDLDLLMTLVSFLQKDELFNSIEPGYSATQHDKFCGEVVVCLHSLKIAIPQKFGKGNLEYCCPPEASGWFESDHKDAIVLALRDALMKPPSKQEMIKVERVILQNSLFFKIQDLESWWEREARPLLLNRLYDVTREEISRDVPDFLSFMPELRMYGVDMDHIEKMKHAALYFQNAQTDSKHVSLVLNVLRQFEFTLDHDDLIKVLRFGFDEAEKFRTDIDGPILPLADRIEFLYLLNGQDLTYGNIAPQLLWPLCQLSQWVDRECSTNCVSV